VISVAPVMHPDWLPEHLPDVAPLRAEAERYDGWILDGYSAIVDPAGSVMQGPLIHERGILLADLDLDLLLARRSLFDAVGHYNRPDVFQLLVDDRPKRAVVMAPANDQTKGE
jgi:nitrilase